MIVRLARENELPRINELRKQVNELHVSGRPDVFKPGFPEELQELIHVIWNDPEKEIVVSETDGVICGFAVVHHVRRPENPFMMERDYLGIEEFCVDEAFRRHGAASALIRFIRDYAKEKGLHRVELDVWEFNQDAQAFYEAVGFRTFRRYMEMRV